MELNRVYPLPFIGTEKDVVGVTAVEDQRVVVTLKKKVWVIFVSTLYVSHIFQGAQLINVESGYLEKCWALDAGTPLLSPVILMRGDEEQTRYLLALRGNRETLFAWDYKDQSTHAGISLIVRKFCT